MKKISILLAVVAIVFVSATAKAQDSTVIIDGIIGKVGDQVVLKSDIEKMMLDYNFPDTLSANEARCEIMKTTIYQKLLLNQAYIDSIVVSDEEVEADISQRMNYFIQQIGSKEALEDYYHKSVTEIKDEMFDPIREMKLIERMKNQIVGTYKISPTEVKEFFEKIPKDSLPYYNAEIEVAHILMWPKPTKEEEEKAKEKLAGLRKRIISGDKFETMAILYSQDKASATKGGDLGMHPKSDFVAEFSAAALRLKVDSISPIINTEYCYHIIKMVDRKGESFRCKHILIKPKITSESTTEVIKKLNDIRDRLIHDTLKFSDAAILYSEDEVTRNGGGVIYDQNSGSSKVSVDQMDPKLFFMVDTMKVGQISAPVPLTYPDGRIAYRIIMVKSKTPPHQANMKDDYPKIKEFAEQANQTKILNKWIDKTLLNTSISLKAPYNNCQGIKEDILSKQPKNYR